MRIILLVGLLIITSCADVHEKQKEVFNCINDQDGYSDCFLMIENDTLLRYSINKDSVKEGWYSEYYVNDKLKYQGLYVDGEKVGEHSFYDESGLLDSICIYSFDIFTSKIEYDQIIRFTENGDTAFERSHFVDVKGAKRIREGERFKFDINLIGAKYAKNIQAYLNIVSGSGDIERLGLAPFESDSLALTYNHDKTLTKGEYILQGVVYDAEKKVNDDSLGPFGEYMFISIPLTVQ